MYLDLKLAVSEKCHRLFHSLVLFEEPAKLDFKFFKTPAITDQK